MTPLAQFAAAGLAGHLALAALGLLLAGRPRAAPLVYGGSAVLAAGLVAGVLALGWLGLPFRLALPVGLPGTGMHLRLDALSAMFLVVVNGVAAAVALHAVGAGRNQPAPGQVLPLYPLFLLGMNVVLVADDAFTFLVGWEVMSLASWGLVLVRRDAEARRAGHLYLVMAAGGALALLAAFALLAAPGGGLAFDAMRGRALPEGLAALVLALAFLGTGSKAGLVPLHVWLPLAHPAAPSHVSALLSGVMTKIAVYGALRIVFDLMSQPRWWWALPFLIAGIASAVVGLLRALFETDLKRVLAFSTIENLGLVAVAIGLSLAFATSGLAAAAAVAMTAGLFHVANHAVIKSLLFCAAGRVVHAAGTADLDRLGGLIGRMPATAGLMLVGAAAIAGLPPLNGFASEWLVFQAVLASPELPVEGLKYLSAAVGALLALVAALAAACFVRAYGIAMLGRPRSAGAETAHEADRWSLAGLAVLAAACVLGGTLAPLVVDALRPAVAQLVGAGLPPQAAAGPAPLSLTPFSGARSTYNGMIILVFLIVSGSLTAALVHRSATRAMRRAPAWDCGFPDASPATQYTAASLGQPIRRVFGPLAVRSGERIRMADPGTPAPARFVLVLIDPVWSYLYTPAGRLVAALSARLNPLQFLSIRNYLSLMFGALVVLLLVVVLWR